MSGLKAVSKRDPNGVGAGRASVQPTYRFSSTAQRSSTGHCAARSADSGPRPAQSGRRLARYQAEGIQLNTEAKAAVTLGNGVKLFKIQNA